MEMPVLYQVIFEAMFWFGMPFAALFGVGLYLQGKMLQAMITPPSYDPPRNDDV